MYFDESLEFKKELKKLNKKYKSLDKDLKYLKSVITAFPKGNGSKHWLILHKTDEAIVYKVRMQCLYLKKKSFRVIYIYNYKKDEIEFVEFIEIFFKGSKESENKQRIKEYLKNIKDK